MGDETNAQNHLPRCIGFVMDGNRRWAKDRGEETLVGHQRGADVFVDTVRFIRDQGIPHAVFYAFSSENWNRSPEEVNYLMDLFASQIELLHQKLSDPEESERKVRFRFIGDLQRFAPELQEKIRVVEAEGKEFTDTTVWIALSYGGRDEILNAVNQAVKDGTPVDENTFQSLLWTADMPDPDLIVRTGGQQRLSNFLTWQSVYSELVFLDQYWPDTTVENLKQVLDEYAHRQRNFGK